MAVHRLGQPVSAHASHAASVERRRRDICRGQASFVALFARTTRAIGVRPGTNNLSCYVIGFLFRPLLQISLWLDEIKSAMRAHGLHDFTIPPRLISGDARAAEIGNVADISMLRARTANILLIAKMMRRMRPI